MRTKQHKYTEEELQFFNDYAVGHYRKEIQEEFIKRFGWNITMGQVIGRLNALEIKTGVNNHFRKGHIPHNKGKKVSPKIYKNLKIFGRGHMPPGHQKIGTERLTASGYVKIKVAEPNVWEYKHRIMYEQYHNVKLTVNDTIIFVDNNKLNFNKDNLELINKNILSDINNRLNFHTDDVEIRKAVIALAKARYELKNKKKELRKE